MRFDEVIQELDALSEKLNGRNIVLQLTKKDATDWDRGRIQGQIEMLSKVFEALSNRETDKELDEIADMDGKNDVSQED